MFHFLLEHGWTSLVAQTVKNLPAVRETRDQSLGWEDPLEKGMATHSSILAWTILWTEEPGKLQSMSLQRVRHDWSDLAHTARGCFNVLRQFLPYGKVNQLYIRTCPLFSEFPSRSVTTEPQGEFSALHSRFLLVVYSIHSSAHVNHSLPKLPTPCSPWCPSVCSLCLCLYFCKQVHL